MDQVDLRTIIIERYSPDELIELLDLETEDIVDAFYDVIFQTQLHVILEDLRIDEQCG